MDLKGVEPKGQISQKISRKKISFFDFII